MSLCETGSQAWGIEHFVTLEAETFDRQVGFASDPELEAAARKAESQNGEDNEGYDDVHEVALHGEGENRKGHSRYRRGEQEQQPELNNAAPLSMRGIRNNPRGSTQVRRLPNEHGIAGAARPVPNQVNRCPGQHDRGSQHDSRAEEVANNQFHLLIGPRDFAMRHLKASL